MTIGSKEHKSHLITLAQNMRNRLDACHDAKCPGDWYANAECPVCHAERNMRPDAK